MLRRELQFVALFRQHSQFTMRAEISGLGFERLLPPRNALRKRPVNIPESLFCCGVAGSANAVEDAPRLGLLLRLITEERVFESDVIVGGFQAHGLTELVARSLVVAHFEQGICQILVDRGTRRRNRNGFLKIVDGRVVIVRVQRGIGAVKRRPRRIGRLCGRESSNEYKKDKNAAHAKRTSDTE